MTYFCQRDNYVFKSLHKQISIGTASDRYKGWAGKIYLKDYKIETRTKKIGDQTYVEHQLPISSVVEYFEHFDLLELDFTFYSLLLDKNKKITKAYRALDSYSKYTTTDDKIIVKVPQAISARFILEGQRYKPNDTYLNKELFIQNFYDPCKDILQERLAGFIFEQEYHTKALRVPQQVLIQELDSFFSSVPKDHRYHLELRTEAYLKEELYELLRTHGIGLVLSHWTWLPRLWLQYERAKKICYNSNHTQIIRLMTPRNVKYEEAYRMAYPFDEIKEKMLDPFMIKDTLGIISDLVAKKVHVFVVINNRAGGSAPEIAKLLTQGLSTLLSTHNEIHKQDS